MENKFEKEKNLIESGLVNSIMNLFKNRNVNIPFKYYILIADYVDCISQLDCDKGFFLDPIKVVKLLPNVLSDIVESDLYGIHGITNKNKITMNGNLDYETNKLYFFHELTHALQTRIINNHEECSFYNGNTGMFLTEGATQFTAEILYNISNGTNIIYRDQPDTVRGQSNHVPFSALSEYQLNGNILMLISSAFNVPVNQLLALGFRTNGRDLLKQLYESYPENKNKFEDFMLDLEKIYSIDKLLLAGYGNKLKGNPVLIQMQNNKTFYGNIKMQGELIEKVERELAANFIANNDTDYVLANYDKILIYLTTYKLKQEFINIIKELSSFSKKKNNSLM